MRMGESSTVVRDAWTVLRGQIGVKVGKADANKADLPTSARRATVGPP